MLSRTRPRNEATSIGDPLPLRARSSAWAAAAPMAMQGPMTRTLESAALSPSMQRPTATMFAASAGTRLPNGTLRAEIAQDVVGNAMGELIGLGAVGEQAAEGADDGIDGLSAER